MKDRAGRRRRRIGMLNERFRHDPGRLRRGLGGGCGVREDEGWVGLESLDQRLLLSAVISEFMANNDTTLQDGDNQFSDWIEIENRGPGALDLNGWYLTDDPDDLTRWQFHTSVNLGVGDHVVVFASSQATEDYVDGGGNLHTTFALDAGGEYLALVEADGTTVAHEFISNNGEYPNQFSDISYGLENGVLDETYFLEPTPGAANAGATTDDPSQRIVINEIMYRPSTDAVSEEYIELFNNGSLAVDLGGWSFDRGVSYTFDLGVTMDPGEYLVVAADVAAFNAKYPTVSAGGVQVVGGWNGQLSNKTEEIRLVDASGDRIDRVTYADEGDWAERRAGENDRGHTGWVWNATHDGGGASLELANPDLSNRSGQNWDASPVDGETPGAVNTNASSDVAPLIVDVDQDVIVPDSSTAVTITAELRDESSAGLGATLYWRLDEANNANPFTAVVMLDDGLSGDGIAGDRTFGATIPAQADGAVIEYYVEATDVGANTRTYPAPTDELGGQGANLLYQVDDGFSEVFDGGDHPRIYLIMTEDERDELEDIWDGGGNDEELSNAQMNGTFVYVDGDGVSVRYQVGLRNRGNGSRIGPPNNVRINMPSDDRWRGREALNINNRTVDSQIVGALMFQRAGIATANTIGVGLYVNAEVAASQAVYAYLEPLDSEFAEEHFPEDSSGNLYRAKDENDTGSDSDLGWEGSDPDAYRDTYFKQTNSAADDWSDLINLVDVLNNEPNETFFAAVSDVINVEQWMRFIATDSLLGNREGGLQSGRGDDFAFYRGEIDTRFELIPYDLDTVMRSFANPNRDIFVYDDVQGLDNLLSHPETVPMYYQAFLDAIDTYFNPATLNPLIDYVLEGVVGPGTIANTKQWVVDRTAGVLAQIPQALTVSSGLNVLGEFPRTTDGSTVDLSGRFHAGRTRSVTVNGVIANYDAKDARWSLDSLGLHPGVNRLLVEAWDGAGGTGEVIDAQFIDVWNDTGVETVVGGDVDGSGNGGVVTWDAASGPYHVTSDVTVLAGTKLVIEAGTSVYVDEGIEIEVLGEIEAVGDKYNRIRLTSVPNAPLVEDIPTTVSLGLSQPRWAGVHLQDTRSTENVFRFVDVEYAQDRVNNLGSIGAINSDVWIDNSTFRGTHLRGVYGDDTSMRVSHSVFADVFAADEMADALNLDNISEQIKVVGVPPAGGHLIIENNLFGTNKGHNDVIDADSGRVANGEPILQVLNNVFAGAGDELLDLGGDVYVAGNYFANVFKDDETSDRGYANVISTGDAGTGTTIVVHHNVFFDVDHAVNLKRDTATIFEQNTVVTIHPDFIDRFGNPNVGSVINLYVDEPGATAGDGAYLEGNILMDIPRVFGNPDRDGTTSALQLVNNLIDPAVQSNEVGTRGISVEELGTNNLFDSARFMNGAFGGFDDFGLLGGSPAIGANVFGDDYGAHSPRGARISGEPAEVTGETDATLTIGGAGMFAYQWRLDGGAWSADVPIGSGFDSAGTVRTATLELTGLSEGDHTVEVRGRNFAGELQETPTVSKTWTVVTGEGRVRINEVLASNNGAVVFGQDTPDLIELYNDGDAAIDMSGMSITDNVSSPLKFVFPEGTMLEAGEYMVLHGNSLPSQNGEFHVGFNLSINGEGVHLFDSVANGGGIIDSIGFGIQITNMSIGRTGQDASWGLTLPTLGSANVAQQTGDVGQLSINEWFTLGSFDDNGDTFTDDFIEIYNADDLPVELSGLYLTDDPDQRPDRNQIEPLSFIGAESFTLFRADDNEGAGPDHLNFNLNHEYGWIGLYGASLTELDLIYYKGHEAGGSEGRSPEGSDTIVFFDIPTPAQDASPPSIPSDLRFDLVSDNQIDLSWDASIDPQTGVSGYRIFRDGLEVGTSVGPSFSDTSVQPNVIYEYSVSAINGVGLESAQSAALSTGADFTPPTNPTDLTGVLVGTGQVDLTWTASVDPDSGVKDYVIYRNGVEIGVSTTTDFSDSGASAGEPVFYEVSARNDDDVESARSLRLHVIHFEERAFPDNTYAGTDDTWISENSPGANNGEDNDIEIDGEDPLEDLALIKWDVSAIPVTATIHDVTLTLDVSNRSVQRYELYAALRDWDEGAATWNAATSTEDWETPGARGTADRGTTILGRLDAGSTGVYVMHLNAEGLAQVQRWVDGTDENYGFIISDSDNSDGIQFDSSESGNPPRFAVSYTDTPNDTTPPSIPGNVSTIDNGASVVTVSWDASIEPESSVQAYRVFQDDVFVGSTSGLSLDVTGLTPGVEYGFEVSAVNVLGLESDRSAPPVLHTIAVDGTEPSTPTNLLVNDNGSNQITLSWTAAVDDESGIGEYVIYRDSVEVGRSSGTSFVDGTVEANTVYTYEVSAVNGQGIEGALSDSVDHELIPAPVQLRMVARDSYLPGTGMLVRLEMLDAMGDVDRGLWDAVGTLEVSDPGVEILDPVTGAVIDEVTLYNGMGSLLVEFSGVTGPFTLSADVNGFGTSKVIDDLTGTAVSTVSGVLPGSATWSGVVNVTGDVTVSAGDTLTIDPGTLILLDGDPVGSSSATEITVEGTLIVNGTEESPATFTASDPENPWGRLHVDGGNLDADYAVITRAGNSPGGGHTGTGPAIRLEGGGDVTLEDSSVTDLRGKIMWSSGGDAIIRDTLFSRAVMGPEISSTSLEFTDSWILEMAGVYHPNGTVDDNDAIYLHDQQAGQDIILTGSVFANTQDDGIDTLGSFVETRDVIVRDILDKGISILAGGMVIERSLITNADIGINAKGNGNDTPDVTILHTTIARVNEGIVSQDKDGPDPDVVITYDVTNSIIAVNPGGTAVTVDPIYDPNNTTIQYSVLSQDWTFGGSANNVVGDPLFTNEGGNDFSLTASSPAVDAGDPGSPLDPDGTRADAGYLAFFQQVVGPDTEVDVFVVPRILPTGSDLADVLPVSDNDPVTGGGGIDFWQREGNSFVAEIWVKSDQNAEVIESGTVEFRFNPLYVQVTGVDHGSIFDESESSILDNVAGTLTITGSTAVGDNAGDDEFVLLARVLMDANGPIDPLAKEFGPFASGVMVDGNGSSFEVADSGTVEAEVTGASPALNVRSVIYDFDNNGIVNFADLGYFLPAMGDTPGGSEPPYATWADFNNDDIVDTADRDLLLGAFGKSFGETLVIPVDARSEMGGGGGGGGSVDLLSEAEVGGMDDGARAGSGGSSGGGLNVLGVAEAIHSI